MKKKGFARILAVILVVVLLLSTASVLFVSGFGDQPQEIHAEISDAI